MTNENRDFVTEQIDINAMAVWLHVGRRFAFSRWGDGEWAAVLGERGENCDGHQYFPRLGKELRNALIPQADYYYGILPIAVKAYGDEIVRFQQDTGAKLSWCDGRVLIDANIAGKLYPVIKQLRAKKVLYVGPKRLRGLRQDFFECDWVDVPLKNAYLAKAEVKQEIISKVVEGHVQIIGFSAGMMTKAVINDLYHSMIGKQITLIDFGSMWDGYYGHMSRKYMSQFDWNELRKANTVE